LSSNNINNEPKPSSAFNEPPPGAGAGPQPNQAATGARIFCPACGILVRLPATECPQCKANLRTGEKPEEYIPLWKRGKTKILIILCIIGIPALLWNYASKQTDKGLWQYLSDRFGLETCAEPRNMWDEFNQKEFESGVKKGYDQWNKDENSRMVGQDPNGPETPEQAVRSEKEKILARDNRSYFASTLMSDQPSKNLKPTDNWYMLFPGEWDVAYILKAGTPDEQIIAGEWTFTWINDGQALQDVLSVPYRWQTAPKGFDQIQSTSTRLFNPKLHVWEGFHIQDSGFVFFRSARSQDRRIVEHYQTEGGPLVVTTFSDFTATSFKVTINESTNNGASYKEVAQIWAKKREVIVP
jgi:hypothetical protein